MGALMFLVCAVGAIHLAIGRAVCPRAERLPWQDLGFSDLLATQRRGWYALGQHSELARVMDQLEREHG